MRTIFKKQPKRAGATEAGDGWESVFSDCVVADFLSAYSVCQTENNRSCRYVVRYGEIALCSHPGPQKLHFGRCRTRRAPSGPQFGL